MSDLDNSITATNCGVGMISTKQNVAPNEAVKIAQQASVQWAIEFAHWAFAIISVEAREAYIGSCSDSANASYWRAVADRLEAQL